MTLNVLITGASSGFGEACARKYLAEGHKVILGARNVQLLEKIKIASENSDKVFFASLDVRDNESIASFYDSIPDNFRPIDILINNAGLALGLEPAHEANLEDWETMVDTNIKGLIRVTRKFLPDMVEQNSGHVVNMGSIAGAWPYPGGNTYGSTKSFVQQFSRSLRSDLLGKKIRVTNIDPGLAETNFSVVRMKGNQNKADSVYENTQPLVASDIADIIYWTTSVPEHVNINTLEVMPTCQAWGPLLINREMDYT